MPGLAVLKLQPGASLAAVEATLRQLGAAGVAQKYPKAQAPSPERPGSVELRTIYQFSYPTALPLAKVRQALLATGAVAYVEPLYQRAPLYQPNDPGADSTGTNPALTQYYLKNIQAYRGWDLSRGDSTVVIGISDTGTRFTHEDLRGQLKHNYADPIDGRDNDNDGYVDNFQGWDLADNDNNPTAEAPYGGHGVLVAGCVVARPDNGKGLAGVGFNCRYLPLKVYPSTAGGVFGGYESVVYGADHGCRIINLSWGGTGGKSQYEQDIINYAALNKDVLVVAAAGNANAELDFYPASYDNVVSVAGVSPTDRQVLTYSYRVALSAPGDFILTTEASNDSSYIPVAGSSFAAPIVAGAAGLVRSKYPQLSAAQVAAVLRRTTDDIYSLPGNTALVGKLGTGRLNVRRALALGPNQTAVRVLSQRLSRPRLLPADTARLTLTIQNLLQPVQGLTLSVSSLTPQLSVSGGATLGSLATSATATVPLQLSVAAGTPAGTRAVLRCRFTASGDYQDDQYVVLELNPDYVVLTANDLHLTVTSRGNLGYDGTDNQIGASITYRNSPNLLSEGGLLVATGPAKVMDHLRSAPLYTTDADFLTRQPIRMVAETPARQQAAGAFQDSLPSLSRGRTLGIRVRQRAWAWSAPATDRDYAIVEYTVRNVSADTLRPLHAGLFMDWDLPGDAGHNVANWDSTRYLGYVADAVRPTVFAGLRLLQPTARPAVRYYAINNAAGPTAPLSFADGFSSAEKFLTLNSGTRQNRAGGTVGSDVSHVLGAALGRLAPNDSVTVAFAVVAAPTLAQLQAAADAAQIRYQQVLPTRAPAAALTWQVYPNPTTGQVRVILPIAAAERQAELLDALGRSVGHWPVPATTNDLNLGRISPGVYSLRIRSDAGWQVQRVVLQR
ncbi:hypothetical protein B0919_19010 [Hymenobacter sp. CRA2]|nr:hypothetical protein B0919_19010 [Hymenobacter sp. CRA2]